MLRNDDRSHLQYEYYGSTVRTLYEHYNAYGIRHLMTVTKGLVTVTKGLVTVTKGSVIVTKGLVIVPTRELYKERSLPI